MNWIPKGKESPSTSGQAVLITTNNGVVMEAWGDFYGFYRNEINVTTNVIAWMPMPKPYVK